MNKKGEIREYLDDIKGNFKTYDELIQFVEDMISSLESETILNTERISFFRQMRKELMSKDEAIVILEKAFSKQRQIGNKDIGEWTVFHMGQHYGYFISTNIEDGKFSLIYRTSFGKNEYETTIIKTLPYNKVERLIKFAKYTASKIVA